MNEDENCCFDSGLGSLSIIKAIQKRTKADIIYLADKKIFRMEKRQNPNYTKLSQIQFKKFLKDLIQM